MCVNHKFKDLSKHFVEFVEPTLRAYLIVEKALFKKGIEAVINIQSETYEEKYILLVYICQKNINIPYNIEITVGHEIGNNMRILEDDKLEIDDEAIHHKINLAQEIILCERQQIENQERESLEHQETENQERENLELEHQETENHERESLEHQETENHERESLELEHQETENQERENLERQERDSLEEIRFEYQEMEQQDIEQQDNDIDVNNNYISLLTTCTRLLSQGELTLEEFKAIKKKAQE